MNFFISNICTITGIEDPVIMATIKKRLTIANPFYNKKTELGLSTWNVPTTLTFYDQIAESTIQVPVGVLPDIISYLKENYKPIQQSDIHDLRLDTSDIGKIYFKDIKFTGTLRDYQQEIVDCVLDKTIGVVEAMTGSGKTITFVKIIVDRKIPTLILVNTLELANQIIDSFVTFTNLKKEDIGYIGNGKFILKPITVALHQTMHKLGKSEFGLINSLFGQVIADEVHIVAAKTYYKTMTSLKAKYKFGFSATPKRDDGLTNVIYFATGPKIHTVPLEKLKDVLIVPSYKQILTDYYFPLMDSKEYIMLLDDLSIDKDRNQKIAQEALTNYNDKYVCLLCNRINQVIELKNLLGEEAVIIHSKTKKKERLLAMEQLKNKQKRYVISTFGLFSTGIDIPHLDTIFICAPIRSEVKLRQTAGRIMRLAEDKGSATIVDFVDYKIELLRKQANKRKYIFNQIMTGTL